MRSLVVIGVLIAFPSFGAEPLTDQQLEAISAGTEEVPSDELLKISAQHQTANGRKVAVDGTLDLERAKSIDVGSLMLRDNAQSNLKSLVNINAVQSNVNVLLNLNIMIDSHVGELRQLNLSGK
jgi:hypothetical protein